ncbi:MAG TPA: transcriptional regulator GcvA [Alphaproteobacteria bacterium]|nr:transcriptional regulator GcvA [Alphaproteobacteria bacterium]
MDRTFANLPLTALRAFEATGRHLSVKRAAAELNVTPGAVSQQIRLLEETLGRPLFRRSVRSIALTEAGAGYHAAVASAFGIVADATRRFAAAADRTLTVSTTPTFAMKWLLPRLARFNRRHPGLDIRIQASTALADFRSDGVDLGIRHGFGRYPGLHSDLLFSVDFFPVCSPGLLEGGGLETPADLARHTLLHDATGLDWEAWLVAHEVEGVAARSGIVFSDGSMALQAAADGAGVALGRSRLVAHDLAEGRLVRPFDLTTPGEFAYYVVTPADRADEPPIAAMRAFLLAEARADGPDEVG